VSVPLAPASVPCSTQFDPPRSRQDRTLRVLASAAAGIKTYVATVDGEVLLAAQAMPAHRGQGTRTMGDNHDDPSPRARSEWPW
jgi:hypothetical protein